MQVKMVLTMPNNALIGKPTKMVNTVHIVDTPLITMLEPVDACSNLLQAFLYFRCFAVYFP